jgi:uncharacterized protein with PQ loop repeat
MQNSVEDDFTRFVGGASVILALTATLPQIYYSFKTKTAKGCSWWFLLSRLGITILMTIYGIHLEAEMLIFLNVIFSIGALVMVYYKFVESCNYYKFVESCNNSEIEQEQEEEEEENIL